MTTQLAFARDYQGYTADAPDFAMDVFSATLAAGTHSSITIPSNYKAWVMYVQVEPSGWVWISRNGTAAVPAAGTFGSNVSEMAAGTVLFKKKVFAADVIDFITVNSTCDVSVYLYAIQP